MQAITTKYFGPTDTRGSKVKATCEAGTLYHPWDYSLNVDENHEAAAVKLAQKLGWVGGNYGHPKGGGMKGAGYCFVFTRERDLAEAVMEWAKTPGNHGGNPYCKEFVKLAERILNY